MEMDLLLLIEFPRRMRILFHIRSAAFQFWRLLGWCYKYVVICPIFIKPKNNGIFGIELYSCKPYCWLFHISSLPNITSATYQLIYKTVLLWRSFAPNKHFAYKNHSCVASFFMLWDMLRLIRIYINVKIVRFIKDVQAFLFGEGG